MTQGLDREAVIEVLAKSLANKPLPKAQVAEIASAISEARHPVIGFEALADGTAVDHLWTGPIDNFNLTEFLDTRYGPLRKIEIFPEGIIEPDSLRLRTTHSV